MKYFKLVFALVLIVSCQSQNNGILWDDDNPLVGMVYDYENQPVSQAMVSLVHDEIYYNVETDINGRFILPPLPRGTYGISIQKTGYELIELQYEFLNPTQILYTRLPSFHQLITLAENQFYQNQFQLSSQTLSRAESIQPESAFVYFLRALIHYERNEWQEALETLNLLSESDRNTNSVLGLRALIAERLEN